MEYTPTHYHTGTDSPQINFSDLIIFPESAINPVIGTAGGTYGATEQAIINALITSNNALIAALQAKGLTK